MSCGPEACRGRGETPSPSAPVAGWLGRLRAAVRARLRGSWTRARILARLSLAAAISPALGWGPFTHPHINRRALEEAERMARDGDGSVNKEILDLARRHRETFIFAGNSADAISNHHVLHGLPIYDYSHNYLPDRNTDGQPLFGYSLIDEYFAHRERYPERDGVVALGWLAHQLADWYPHYAHVTGDGTLNEDERAPADEVNAFSGYADAHAVFGSDFFAPVLAEHRLVNHALIELLWDLLVLEREGRQSYLDRNRVELCSVHEGRALISECARRFAPEHCLIPPEHIAALKEDFDFVIDGMRILTELMKRVRPELPEVLRNARGTGVGCGEQFIEGSVRKLVRDLFCAPTEALRERALSPGRPAVPARPLALDVITKPATLGGMFFGFARQLGMTAALSVLKPILSDPVGIRIRGRLLWVLGWEAEVGSQLVSGLCRAASSQLLGAEPKQDPLRQFLAALLLNEGTDLVEAVQLFREGAKPVIASLQPDGVRLLTPAVVRQMLSEGRLRVRIYPASGFSQADRRRKGIDAASLLFRLNGYPVADPVLSDLVDVKVGFEGGDPEAELVVDCRLKHALSPGEYHLFIDARDHSGIWARHQDLLVHVE